MRSKAQVLSKKAQKVELKFFRRRLFHRSSREAEDGDRGGGASSAKIRYALFSDASRVVATVYRVHAVLASTYKPSNRNRVRNPE